MKLSKNEKMILWGLVKYPLLNDRQLSDKIGVRMSTLNAIKNKMKRGGLIQDRIIPNIEVMDFELLSIVWMPLQRVIKSKKDQDFVNGLFSRHPKTYTALIFGDTLLFMSLYRSYSEYRRSLHSLLSELNEKGLLNSDLVHNTLYPLSLSRINKNFDYTDVLEKAFDIPPSKEDQRRQPERDLSSAREKIHHLTKKEKLILKGILQKPDLPDNKIASMLDTTRQAVARHKKELLELGVIRKTRVIDYGQLGLNILCLVEARYEKFGGLPKDLPNITHLHLPSFFAIYGISETVSLSLFPKFENFTESREKYTAAMNDFCVVKGEPHIRLFSPSDTLTLKHQEYLPLVEEFLKEN